ncbi:MAG: glycosyltransferase family 39 protein [Polyangiaceae bacterium]|nr:glycosyltransferase family 39 protein [Polyangiaceae bacterium]
MTRLDRRDLLAAALIVVAATWLLTSTAGTLGYARDEGFYFAAAESYARWFELLLRDPGRAVTRASVDAAWSVNHEHPALLKSLFALSWSLLHGRLHLFAEEGTSFRFPAMVLSGVATAVTYLWGTEARGRRAGAVAAGAFFFVPTTFYHSHLDCFDVPIAALWTLTAWAYWRSLIGGGWRWAVLAGVLFGLALDTKHNSWFLPFFVCAHTCLSRRAELWEGLRRGRLSLPLAIPCMALLGPLVFVAGWPWLWYDTASRFFGYVQFHTRHEYYNMEFLGQTYWRPPFPRGYAWLMTAATVPAVTLVAALVGVALAARRARRPHGDDPGATDLAWALGALIGFAPWLSTGTPIFGGTKHWLTAYPFLALFAGVGVDRALSTLGALLPPRRARWAVVAATVCVCASPVVQTLRAHPWGLSAYTPLVGGAPGAATLGLNRGFWGYTTGSVLDVLNGLPKGSSVYLHDTAWDSWKMLQRDGRLRGDLRATLAPSGADAALYHHEAHMAGVEQQIWVALGTTTPAAVRGLDGVPIVWVYLKAPHGSDTPPR